MGSRWILSLAFRENWLNLPARDSPLPKSRETEKERVDLPVARLQLLKSDVYA